MDAQTPEELEAQYASSGPVAAALEWADAMRRRDFKALWSRTDPTFRLVTAQRWIWAHRTDGRIEAYDRDELAAALSKPEGEHPLKGFFAEAVCAEPLPDDLAGASRPRPVGPGYELVLLVPGVKEAFVVNRSTEMFAFGMLMHFRDSRWMVSGQDIESPATPGWPPVEGHRAGNSPA